MPGTITRAQGFGLETAFRAFIDELDQRDAQWALDNFQRIQAFVRRRPSSGLLMKESNHVFKARDFLPRGEALEKAGLLKWRLAEYVAGSGERDEWFPGTYDGPSEFRCTLVSYAMGDPQYREDVMRGVSSGLPRVAADLRARGFHHANFHQAASFAAEVSEHLSAEDWVYKYGPCRIYALGTHQEPRRSEQKMVPVLLTPGVKDDVNDHRDRSMQWRLDSDFNDRDGYRRPDVWFLTVTPYNG
jgi:hypothetical protein